MSRSKIAKAIALTEFYRWGELLHQQTGTGALLFVPGYEGNPSSVFRLLRHQPPKIGQYYMHSESGTVRVGTEDTVGDFPVLERLS